LIFHWAFQDFFRKNGAFPFFLAFSGRQLVQPGACSLQERLALPGGWLKVALDFSHFASGERLTAFLL
jgi:hypothetical protein